MTTPYRRILVPLDDSRASTAALAEALRLAKASGATVRLVHLVDDLPVAPGFESYGVCSGEVMQLMKEAGENLLQRAAGRAAAEGVTAQALLIDGFALNIAATVAFHADLWHADLIVMGRHARPALWRRLRGSQAERLMRKSTVPVLLVRAEDDPADGITPRRAAHKAGHALALDAE